MPVFKAPAKINLSLHVTGKREDGYHLLDSLVVFTSDVADAIVIEPADTFSLSITGPFAIHLGGMRAEDNIVFKAAHGFSALVEKDPRVAITIEKNIPAGAGLGGGSADAAATVHGLMDLWKVKPEDAELQDFLLSLGADVPVCFYARPARFCGVGEQIFPAPALPHFPMLLVCPDAHSSTRDVFAHRTGAFSNAAPLPDNLAAPDGLIAFLQRTRNDLSEAAQTLSPVIRTAQNALEAQEGCRIARMSGSGAAVFGLFDAATAAQTALENIRKDHPNWWAAVTSIS